MDEFADYIYRRRPHYRNIDAGDLTQQKLIREKLNCKPFSWFMKEVAYDLVKFYPPVEPQPLATGEVGKPISSGFALYKRQANLFMLINYIHITWSLI